MHGDRKPDSWTSHETRRMPPTVGARYDNFGYQHRSGFGSAQCMDIFDNDVTCIHPVRVSFYLSKQLSS